MIFGLILLFIIWILWFLLIKGFLWKLILFCAGWFGTYIAMLVYIDGSEKIAMTFMDYSFSWAAVVPTFICIMALATTEAE